MRRTLRICLGLSMAGLLLSVATWSAVPNPMPIHWGLYGEPNGFGPRWLGLTLMPVLGILLPAFVGWMLSKTKKGIPARVEATLLISTTAFMLGMHALMIQAALSPDMMLAMNAVMVLMGALFAVLGWVMPFLPQNPVAGIRTPWSLADEVNWELTHRFARWTMTGSGILAIGFSLLLGPPALFWVTFSLVMGGALAPAVASYAIHRMRR